MSVLARGAGIAKSKGVPVKAIVSSNPAEARRRVLALYKQWYRAVPKILEMFQLPYTQEKAVSKIREEFLKNSHVRDVRAIDLLVMKSQMDLQETLLKWKQTCHMKGFFKHQTLVEAPTDFMGKFLSQKH